MTEAHQHALSGCQGDRLVDTVHELPDLNGREWVRSVAHVLRRLAEDAQEATAHSFAIAKSGCRGDLFD